ncbi:MAG: hypothetical protein ACRCXM_00780 [Beijerinckiaceae bacterium]
MRTRFLAPILSVAAFSVLSLAPAPAVAQSPECQEGGKLMQDRQSMIQSLQAATKGKKLTPVTACSRFNGLVSNGQKLIVWLEKNGAWCNAPDSLLENVKADHQKSIGIRGQACGAAAKYRQMMAQAARARAQAARGGQGGGMLGGGGGDIVSGQMRVPAGAL